MTNTRQNVYELGNTWADPILWYAKAVGEMMRRPLNDPTSWRYYAAIHGFDSGLWQQLAYYSPANDPLPSAGDQATFWNQCQHGSWYFLPWHRGYLLAFEANVRQTVVSLGGPSGWTLPYWNYFKAGQNQLPPAFNSKTLPDGTVNPLFIQERYGPDYNGNIYVPLDQVDLKAIGDPDFIGGSSGGSIGFGGPSTGFRHQGKPHGGIESQPHDMVHVLVGGPDAQKPGLMSDPDTAGLDPIFWLHHANIDRLWEVWHQNPPAHQNPPDPKWLNGPASIGQRAFTIPMPKPPPWNYIPSGMVNLGTLGYTYDDLSLAVPAPAPGERLLRLGMSEAVIPEIKGARPVSSGDKVELIGASRGTVPLRGNEARTTVYFDKPALERVSASLTNLNQAPAPDRIFLNLENVKGKSDGAAFTVYIELPKGADSAISTEQRAGSIALFGVRKASRADDEHGGEGLTFVLEITEIFDTLHLNHSLNIDSLDIRLVPVRPVPQSAKVTIEKISIYRQGR